MAEGWSRGAPHDDVELLPLSDGGPGFLDVLGRALGGTTVMTTVSDPLGREVPAAVLLVEREGRRTAFIEASQATGLHLLGADERDPGEQHAADHQAARTEAVDHPAGEKSEERSDQELADRVA